MTAAVLDLTTQEGKPHIAVPQKLSLECSVCGYGIARAEPPERCPMCQAADSWAHRPWRPFSVTV